MQSAQADVIHPPRVCARRVTAASHAFRTSCFLLWPIYGIKASKRPYAFPHRRAARRRRTPPAHHPVLWSGRCHGSVGPARPRNAHECSL